MKLEAFNIAVDESQVYFKKLKKELVLLFCNPIIPGGQKWNTAWEINQTCPEGTLVVRRVYKMQAKNSPMGGLHKLDWNDINVSWIE